jgi:hypothetical protein
MNGNVGRFKNYMATARLTRVDQVFNNLRLRVNGNRPTSEVLKINAVAAPFKAKFNSMMHQALALQAFADPSFG